MINKQFIMFAREEVRRNIIIIGLGGTGGYLAEILARIISLLPDRNDYNLTFVDGDKVENKNLLRQNFTLNDLGKNKAEALANKFCNYGVKIAVYPNFVEDIVQLTNIIERDSIVISCVDNEATRVLIYKGLRLSRWQTIWIDPGNTFDAGQIVVGGDGLVVIEGEKYLAVTESGPGSTANLMREMSLNNVLVPTVIDIYPEIIDEPSLLPTEMSCAERVVSSPQDIMANRSMADIVTNILRVLVFQKSYLEYGLVKMNITRNEVRPILLDTNYLITGSVNMCYNYEKLEMTGLSRIEFPDSNMSFAGMNTSGSRRAGEIYRKKVGKNLIKNPVKVSRVLAIK